MATITTKKSGAWQNPNVWDLGRVPAAGDDVVVGPQKLLFCKVVLSDLFSSVTVKTGGVLICGTDTNWQLKAQKISVEAGGWLYQGTDASDPMQAGINGHMETSFLDVESGTYTAAAVGTIITDKAAS